jgi:hypothetical protein
MTKAKGGKYGNAKWVIYEYKTVVRNVVVENGTVKAANIEPKTNKVRAYLRKLRKESANHKANPNI